MPTIIDSLVVELGFGTQGMEGGRKKVEDAFKKTQQSAQKTGKTIDEEAQKGADYLSRLRNNVIGLYAAFTGGRGLKEFVSDMTTSNAAIGRFAQTVNESVENIAAWRGAGSLMGVSASDIDNTFQNLTSQFEQFRLTGDSTIVPWFRAVGLSMVDINGKMIPLGDQFLNLADKFSTFQDKAQAATIMQNMGISPGMIQIILQGRDAVQKLLDKQKELAAAIAKDAPAAAARQQAWNEFKNSAETIGITLLTSLTPALVALTHAAKAFSDWGERHPEIVAAIFAALTGVILILSTVMLVNLAGTAIGAVVSGFGGLISIGKNLALGIAVLSETALPALSRAFFAVALGIEATPIGWLITGIAALSVAAYELYKHWEDIRRWWKWLWNEMGEDTEAGADKAQEGIESLKGDRQGSPGRGGSGSRSGKPYKEREADVQALEGMGWTRDQAAGIVANIQGESGGDIGAEGDGGKAFGLIQWHPDRQKAFEAWAGHSIRQSTRAEQLGFINYELRSGNEQKAGRALASTSNAGSAADVLTRKYVRPADTEGQAALRSQIANAVVKPPTPLQTSVAVATAKAPSATATPTPGAQQSAVAANDNRPIHVSTSETRIGEMHIHTQAKDATGIARDIGPALKNNKLAQQSNFGQS